MHPSDPPASDWNPFAATNSVDQRDVYDDMREQCPIAYSERLHWSIFRHEDVLRVVTDHETFSNQVSRYRSVPNGMDPPEHTVYRKVILPYFADERLREFEPLCHKIVAERVARLLQHDRVELISDFALDVAVQIHCAFLGWPAEENALLADWTARSRDANRANDQAALGRIAREFEELVSGILEKRRAAGESNGDVTDSLMRETVYSRPLDDLEIASILRNWTVGEIGTASASIGILAHYLAEHPDLQDRLRAEPALLPPAIDEILRIRGPLVTNRRVTTRAVEIGGRTLDAGERLSVNWVSANRDARVFDDPTAFSLDRDPSKNLLFGAGIHVCPGAPLARLELRLVMEHLLDQTSHIELDPDAAPEMALYPASGFATLPLRMR